MNDSPQHEADRIAAVDEASRRGLHSALENMITIPLEAPSNVGATTMSAGREAIIDSSPIPSARVAFSLFDVLLVGIIFELGWTGGS